MTNLRLNVAMVTFLLCLSACASPAANYYRTLERPKAIAEMEQQIDSVLLGFFADMSRRMRNGQCRTLLIYNEAGAHDPFNCSQVEPASKNMNAATGHAGRVARASITDSTLESPFHPGHFSLWTRVIERQVNPLAMRAFDANYVPFVGNGGTGLPSQRTRQRGAEYLLQDGRTLLIFRFADSMDSNSATYQYAVTLSLADVRTIPPFYSQQVVREADFSNPYGPDQIIAAGTAGDKPEYQALRLWTMTETPRQTSLSRPLSMDALKPRSLTPAENELLAISDELKGFGIGLAELRWARLAQHRANVGSAEAKTRIAAAKLRAEEARALQTAMAANRRDGNRTSSDSSSNPIFVGMLQGLSNVAEREQEYARIRGQVARQFAPSRRRVKSSQEESSTNAGRDDQQQKTMAASSGIATSNPASTGSGSGAVLSSSSTPASAATSRCGPTPSQLRAHNQGQCARNSGFSPAQSGSICVTKQKVFGGQDCDVSEMSAQLKQDGNRAFHQREWSESRAPFGPRYTYICEDKDAFVTGDFGSRRRHWQVETQITQSNCAAAMVNAVQSLGVPGVECDFILSYQCRLAEPTPDKPSASGR